MRFQASDRERDAAAERDNSPLYGAAERGGTPFHVGMYAPLEHSAAAVPSVPPAQEPSSTPASATVAVASSPSAEPTASLAAPPAGPVRRSLSPAPSAANRVPAELPQPPQSTASSPATDEAAPPTLPRASPENAPDAASSGRRTATAPVAPATSSPSSRLSSGAAPAASSQDAGSLTFVKRQHPYREYHEEHVNSWLLLKRKGRVIAQKLHLSLSHESERRADELRDSHFRYYQRGYAGKDWTTNRLFFSPFRSSFAPAPPPERGLLEWLQSLYTDEIEPLHSQLHTDFQAGLQARADQIRVSKPFRDRKPRSLSLL